MDFFFPIDKDKFFLMNIHETYIKWYKNSWKLDPTMIENYILTHIYKIIYIYIG